MDEIEKDIETEPVIAQTPYIKLIRNPKGVYHWEIKVLNHDIEAINRVDMMLRLKYGQ
jgi:hypothetical protein